ncbi:hypothetical protein N783_07230, partial [Pontibacillus marinus BH030004 = DSM 16465]
TGPTGPTGECVCLPRYCDFYFEGTTINVAPNSSIPFNEEGECTEDDFTPVNVMEGTFTQIEVEHEGDYLINYSVIFNNTPPTEIVEGAFALFVDGLDVDASRFGETIVLASQPAGAQTKIQVNGEAIVHIPEGGILELRNISNRTVHVLASVAGADINGAAITIVQLDNDTV